MNTEELIIYLFYSNKNIWAISFHLVFAKKVCVTESKVLL